MNLLILKTKDGERIIGEYTGTEGVHHSRALDRDGGTTGVLFYGAIPVKYKIRRGDRRTV